MTEERTFIPLADGTRLATNLYLPDEPAPVILEALPYRKDDLTANYAGEYRRLRDEGGYAIARVDLRGTGSSDGIVTDEYPEQEQKDLVEVIDWLAKQEWSTGNVGMYGTSYSGFNAIQLAMERPPALKAICAIYATDDRYTDDVHFEGGALRGIDQIDYCLYMTAINALPPVPSLYGDGWREAWAERVAKGEPWVLRWIEEQHDSPYWRHGSLRPDYSSIAAATMIVGGWADGYRNATFRMFEQLTCDKRLLIGPWSHASAETSLPGPHIDLVPEMIRWWDRWLKGERNGIENDDPIQLFVRRSTRPAPDLSKLRGEWRTEATWPPDRLREESLDFTSISSGNDRIEVMGHVGATASLSCAGVLPWVQPFDQRPDDALSLCYDFEPLTEDLEILGYPRLEVTVTSEVPVAFLSVKLQDVFPDGTSANVSRGFLNLTGRDSFTNPEPLSPGKPYSVTIDLTATSWVFEAGHHIRVALAGSDWPNVWPPPMNNALTVDAATSKMVLPVVPPQEHPNDPGFLLPPAERGDAPEATKAVDAPQEGSKDPVYRIEHDAIAHRAHVVVDHGGPYEVELGAKVLEFYFGRLTVSTDDPADARAEGRARFEIAWPETTAAAEVSMTLESTSSAYKVHLDLDVTENGKTLWTRRWDRDIPRRLQ